MTPDTSGITLTSCCGVTVPTNSLLTVSVPTWGLAAFTAMAETSSCCPLPAASPQPESASAAAKIRDIPLYLSFVLMLQIPPKLVSIAKHFRPILPF